MQNHVHVCVCLPLNGSYLQLRLKAQTSWVLDEKKNLCSKKIVSQLGKMFKGQFCVVCITKLELYKKETSLYPPGILQRRRHSIQLAWLYSNFSWISLFSLCFVTKRTVNIIKDSTVGAMHFQVSSLKRLCNDVKKLSTISNFMKHGGCKRSAPFGYLAGKQLTSCLYE